MKEIEKDMNPDEQDEIEDSEASYQSKRERGDFAPKQKYDEYGDDPDDCMMFYATRNERE